MPAQAGIQEVIEITGFPPEDCGNDNVIGNNKISVFMWLCNGLSACRRSW
jgi:hypothetical protein